MKLQENFLLSKITTFQLGGPAKFYLKVRTPEEAVAAVLIAQDKKIKYHLVGGGSNLVFNDEGFAGLVIHWQIARPSLADIMVKKKEREIIVSAVIKLADLIKTANKNGLAGLEKLAGIPGQVGGAVVGNAGAYGQAISDRLRWVEVFDGQRVRRLTKKNCCFDYRESIFKKNKWLVLRVAFKLKKGQAQNLIKESQKITKIRWAKFGQHPICAGSFFKNVYQNGERLPTATLIEQAGAINLKAGGISVAPWHHNFLINDGSGTTRDLKKLAKRLKKVVHQKLGIELAEEVRFVV
ncbi:MAG: UDP-N-acetylmuramate dehydrogenase [Candidatus Paceibacterota bacterium]